MRIGIYGGSFNPVHYGHTGLAQWVINHTDLDELWLMVSPNNPLKDAHSLAPEQERLHAVQDAVRDIPGVRASDFEFGLPRPSYTAHTLRALQEAYPEHTFTLVIGEDNLAIFNHWAEHEFILRNFRLFVYPRRHAQASAVDFSNAEYKIVFLSDAPYFDISSTQIREKIKTN